MESLTGNAPSVCIIGAGNVATHIARALSNKARVLQIISRHPESAQRLASSISGCEGISDITELRPDAQFYIIAVNDDAIAGIAASTPDYPGIWTHTSGSIPAEIFKERKSRFGVFYPLQTFSRDIPVDITRVPFFIEGNSGATSDALIGLASLITRKVEVADSERRKKLHVAAVFACNFANQMWADADHLLRAADLDIRFLIPLIEATVAKLQTSSPTEAMTGPARRGDMQVINNHLSLLPANLRATYAMVSQEILKEFHPDLAGELSACLKHGINRDTNTETTIYE